MESGALVYVVDDDPAVRHFLSLRLEMEGLAVKAFTDGPAFIRGYDGRHAGCVVADLRMPRMSGLELQQWMAKQDAPAPLIIMTGHGDLSATIAAFRGGAWDFLEKPFDDQYLVERVRGAIAAHAGRRRQDEARRQAAASFRRLSRREQQVARLIGAGQANKDIAAALDLGLRTVESHRFQVMKKLGVASVAEVTRMVALIEE